MHTKFIFISGTDTDVGKTFMSCALLTGLSKLGLKLSYWKPIQSGPPDSQIVANESQGKWTVLPSLCSFVTPASPDQAAIADSMPQIKLTDLVDATQNLNPDCDLCIIEGAGGLYVPLNDTGVTWLDYLNVVKLPIILVARSGLGTLNHTSLSLNILESYRIKCLGIVLNGDTHVPNQLSLKRMWPEHHLHPFPRIDSMTSHNENYQSEALKLATFLTTSLSRDQFNSIKPSQVSAWDEMHTWHPYTQHASSAPAIEIASAKGVWLQTANGKSLLDATSSWWVNTIGHGRAEIARAMYRQQQQLDHIMFAGMTHQPAAELAYKLSKILGSGFDRVFYSDNGSTAIEVALKMTLQSWKNRGDDSRKTFACLKGSYHGDTVGAMSVSASGGLHGPYQTLLFASQEIVPVLRHGTTKIAPAIYQQELNNYFAKNAHDLIAVIIEPLVQGAGGMLMHDKDWLNYLCKVARSYNVPLIFDEIFVGFGRLGTLFAFEQLDIRPDIICLGKGLTGGTTTLAVTVTSETYFSHFLSADKSKALLHGHSYTANPLACAAALTTLGIYERENLHNKAKHIESRYLQWLEQSDIGSKLEDCRVHGSIFAGTKRGTGKANYFATNAHDICARGVEHGVYIRPLGNTVYTVPPLTITDDELDFLFAALSKICN